jgi:hypothetical protein
LTSVTLRREVASVQADFERRFKEVEVGAEVEEGR